MKYQEANQLAKSRTITTEKAIKLYKLEIDCLIQRAAQAAEFSINLPLPLNIKEDPKGLPSPSIPSWNSEPIQNAVIRSLEDDGFDVKLTSQNLKISWDDKKEDE